MKKHQAIAIILIIILAVVATFFIFGSKKSTEAPTTTPESPTSSQMETTASETSVVPTPTQTPAAFTLAQVATHNSRSSCYTVVSGTVYDVTEWISKHPGGQFAILSMCGKDATAAFKNQHGGQTRPESELASFKIGTLIQ